MMRKLWYFFYCGALCIEVVDMLTSCVHPSGKTGNILLRSQCEYTKDIESQILQPTSSIVKRIFEETFYVTDKNYICCPCGNDTIYNETIFKAKFSPNKPEFCGCKDTDKCVSYHNCPEFNKVIQTLGLSRFLLPNAWWLVINSWRCDKNDGRNFKVCCSSLNVSDAIRYASHPNRENLAAINDCGFTSYSAIKTRIVGGRDAHVGQFPWIANLGYEEIDTRYGRVRGIVYECGGVLIGNRYVLTAGHCIKNLSPTRKGPVSVRFGEHDLSTEKDCSGKVCAPSPQNIEISQIFVHSNFTGSENLHNDIALIQLKASIKKTEYVFPICLPFEHETKDDYKIAKPQGVKPLIFVAGWGAIDKSGHTYPNVMQYLELDIFDYVKCESLYSDMGSQLSTDSSQLCAGGIGGKDSCVGDSGSALMLESEDDTNRWFSIGIVSYGPRRCGKSGIPGIYTRVRAYLDWILSKAV